MSAQSVSPGVTKQGFVTAFESAKGVFDTVPTDSVMNIKVLHPLVRVTSRSRVRPQGACGSGPYVSSIGRVLVRKEAGCFQQPRSDEMGLIGPARSRFEMQKMLQVGGLRT